MLVRDRECFHELCDESAEHGQVDHVEPFSAGGPTTMANGRAACAHHNRQRHRRSERPPP
ncbi:MAG: HNH endonuclease signature motif containing protein [Acidimicrobiales bacterium]